MIHKMLVIQQWDSGMEKWTGKGTGASQAMTYMDLSCDGAGLPDQWAEHEFSLSAVGADRWTVEENCGTLDFILHIKMHAISINVKYFM